MATLQLLAVAILILGTEIPGISGIPTPESPAASSLRWEPFQGSVPAHAVWSWNGRRQRREFVCSTRSFGCNVGSFRPERGTFCSFPWSERELSSADFQLLINPGGFEALDWVDTSFGSVPAGAVEGCPLTDIFVGRSRDGLGKVSKEQQALFVAVDGEEIWYKWYQTLVVRQGSSRFSIADVSYNSSAALDSSEPAEVAAVAVRNAECRAVPKSVTLEELTEVEHTWSAELPAARGVLHAAPVILTDSGWELGNVTAVPWASGAAVTEFVSRSHAVRVAVPARSECSAVLRGSRREVSVPFSAWVTREFRSGPAHRVAVEGWARSRAVTAVRAGLERCRELSELPPCPR